MGDHAATILRGLSRVSFLVAGLSFYVGTLKPKKAVGTPPQTTSLPRN